MKLRIENEAWGHCVEGGRVRDLPERGRLDAEVIDLLGIEATD